MALSQIQTMKKTIRHEVRLKKKELTEQKRQELGNKIYETLIQLPEFIEADSISIYVDFNQEVPTRSIIELAWKLGKEVAAPVVENGTMEFYRFCSMEELQPNDYGILEPCKQYGVVSPNSFVIMPGVAFDEQKNRIGYGGGFYDRYMEKNPNLINVAIAFEFQIYKELFCEEKDYRPTKIITENRIIV